MIFFKRLIFQTVGEGQLHCTLDELVETCEKTLLISLTGKVAILFGSEVEVPPPDLSIPPGVGKVLNLLHQTLGTELSSDHQTTQVRSTFPSFFKFWLRDYLSMCWVAY